MNEFKGENKYNFMLQYLIRKYFFRKFCNVEN